MTRRGRQFPVQRLGDPHDKFPAISRPFSRNRDVLTIFKRELQPSGENLHRHGSNIRQIVALRHAAWQIWKRYDVVPMFAPDDFTAIRQRQVVFHILLHVLVRAIR